MIGLGMWISSETTLKAWRKIHSSKRKSLLSQNLPDSLERESVVDCYDQTSLVEFASSKDSAMVNTVEIPSAITKTGACDAKMQRTETRSHQRNDVPVKKGKACDTLKNPSSSNAGDSSREKGRTQKFLAVHSLLQK